MKWLKSYLVFTSLLYRIVMFILLPGGLIAASFFWRGLGGVVAVAETAVFILAEAMADNWLFGGIHRADGAKLDYLKTSGRGMRLLRAALAMDLARRFLAALLVFGSGLALIGTAEPEFVGGIAEGIGTALFSAIASSCLATLAVFVSRYGDMLWINMLLGYGAAILGLMCWTLPGLGEYIWFYDLIFAVLGLLCGCITVSTAVKKVEGSYYGK